jgi:nitroimidazol reductase NimA-like FMN-containing flavoprotein (pyridoxamine 5'-phosphate oxidase superfamily)
MTRQVMDGPEIGAFLGTQDTGVLGLARENDGYGVPVAFAFDDDESDFYFRLGYGPESQKRRFVESAEVVTFTVYDYTPDGWKSVIAEGSLETLTQSSLESSIEESIRDLEIPYFEVHAESAADLEHNVVLLDAMKLSGITQGRHGQRDAR